MAEPHSLKEGDIVTHETWPKGTTAKVIGFQPFKRFVGRKAGGGYLKNDPKERIVFLDKKITDTSGESDNAWMEAGLLRVDA